MCERLWTLPHSTALAVFEHVSCPSCQPSPALRLANCESDIAISASQAIEGTVITAAAAPGPILERPTGGDHLTAYVRAECVAAIAMHAPLRETLINAAMRSFAAQG